MQTAFTFATRAGTVRNKQILQTMNVGSVRRAQITMPIPISASVTRDTKDKRMIPVARNVSEDSTKVSQASATAQPAPGKISRRSSPAPSCATIAPAQRVLALSATISTTKTPHVYPAPTERTRVALGASSAQPVRRIPRRFNSRASRFPTACVCPATRAMTTRLRRVHRARLARLKSGLATRRVHCAMPRHRRRWAKRRHTRKTACARPVFTMLRLWRLRARHARWAFTKPRPRMSHAPTVRTTRPPQAGRAPMWSSARVLPGSMRSRKCAMRVLAAPTSQRLATHPARHARTIRLQRRMAGRRSMNVCATPGFPSTAMRRRCVRSARLRSTSRG